ncbi:MAG: glycosyltransferase family 4 protein [Thermofilaceae archaeon]
MVIVNGVIPLFKALKSTYVAVAHAVHPHIPLSPLVRLIYKKLYEVNDYVVAITERKKRALVECLNVNEGKVKVIPLCLNTGKYKYRKISDRDKILLHVGTHEAKNLPATLKTFSDLCMEFRDLTLAVVGPHVNEALRPAKELVKPECFSRVYTRTLTKTELRDLYSKALVLVAPSRVEGFPYAVLEAQASGTPAIASKVVPPEAVIDGVTGYRVENTESLSRYVRTLLYDRSLWMKMSLKAREHAENLDCHKIALEYLVLRRESQ